MGKGNAPRPPDPARAAMMQGLGNRPTFSQYVNAAWGAPNGGQAYAPPDQNQVNPPTGKPGWASNNQNFRWGGRV